MAKTKTEIEKALKAEKKKSARLKTEKDKIAGTRDRLVKQLKTLEKSSKKEINQLNNQLSEATKANITLNNGFHEQKHELAAVKKALRNAQKAAPVVKPDPIEVPAMINEDRRVAAFQALAKKRPELRQWLECLALSINLPVKFEKE